VGAVAWDGHDVIYYLDEEVSYYHNLSANVTGFDSDIAFAIDTDTDINWTNASGTFSVSASSVSDWLSITDSASGNLTISAVYDNQTGFFVVPVQASNATGASASVEGFEFQINATNDKPEFVTDLSADFNWTATAKNITITALDEEGHYPLNFSLTNVSCTHGASTGRVLNQDCNIFTLVNTSNTTANIGLTPDLAGLDVGVYVFNLSITEAEHGCPHAYCDNATYNVTNSTTTQITLTVLSLLSINASNCTGTVMEGKQFNCTVNVTTVGATDSIDVSTYALYSNYPSVLSQNINRSWFYANNTDNAVANVLSIPISVTPDKNFVGNWTINFSATDGLTSDVGVIALYVNFTESNVTLDTVY